MKDSIPDRMESYFYVLLPVTIVAQCFPHLRHPLLELQVCEIGRREAGGGRKIQSVMKNFSLLQFTSAPSGRYQLRCRECCHQHGDRWERNGGKFVTGVENGGLVLCIEGRQHTPLESILFFYCL